MEAIDTSLIFHEGLDLPYFAAFHLVYDEKGRDALRRYYERYIDIAKADGFGFILGSPTWRASSVWGEKLGYSGDDIAAANQDAIELMRELRAKRESAAVPIVVSGFLARAGMATIRARSCSRARRRSITPIRSKLSPRPAPT